MRFFVFWMLKKIIIVIAVLFAIGLYFSPDITKKVAKVSGNIILDISKDAFNKIKGSEEIQEVKEEVKEELSQKFNETKFASQILA